MCRNRNASARQWAYVGAETEASTGCGIIKSFDISGWEESGGAILIVTNNTKSALIEAHVPNATSVEFLNGEKALPVFVSGTSIIPTRGRNLDTWRTSAHLRRKSADSIGI
jgi:hypothetical protein